MPVTSMTFWLQEFRLFESLTSARSADQKTTRPGPSVVLHLFSCQRRTVLHDSCWKKEKDRIPNSCQPRSQATQTEGAERLIPDLSTPPAPALVAIMSNNITCPDPSVHRNTKLQEQASTAALLASSPSRNKVQASDILDKDNKLSSRSASQDPTIARSSLTFHRRSHVA